MTAESACEIDEAISGTWVIPKGTSQVHFSNSTKEEIDPSSLQRHIHQQDSRHQVTNLRIEYSSRLASSWVVEEFPNLEWLSIESPQIRSIAELGNHPKLKRLILGSKLSRKLKYELLPHLKLKDLSLSVRTSSDIEPIARLKSLDWLCLVNWPLADFARLSHVVYRWFKMIGGKVQSTFGLNSAELKRGRCDLQTNPHLRELRGLNTQYLNVAECRNIDFNSLTDASNLVFLEIENCGNLRSLAFLEHCPSLLSLNIMDTRVTANEFEPLFRSRSLRQVALSSSTPDRTVEIIAAGKPEVFVTNRKVAYSGGKRVDPKDWWLLVEENRKRINPLYGALKKDSK